jgi:hypothetical protein
VSVDLNDEEGLQAALDKWRTPTVCCLGEQTNRPIIGALLPKAHPLCWTYSLLRRAKHDPEIDPEKLIDMIALDKALAGKPVLERLQFKTSFAALMLLR